MRDIPFLAEPSRQVSPTILCFRSTGARPAVKLLRSEPRVITTHRNYHIIAVIHIDTRREYLFVEIKTLQLLPQFNHGFPGRNAVRESFVVIMQGRVVAMLSKEIGARHHPH